MITIKEPRWKEPRSVGLAEDKLTEGLNQIEITYENKQGERIYPEPFGIFGKDAFKYPVQILKGRRLRIIPIDKLLKVSYGYK